MALWDKKFLMFGRITVPSSSVLLNSAPP